MDYILKLLFGCCCCSWCLDYNHWFSSSCWLAQKSCADSSALVVTGIMVATVCMEYMANKSHSKWDVLKYLIK